MSGGRLVVLDRQGRDVKEYPLPEGLATLGSDPACDIRVMLASVSSHHSTVVVHSNQTIVRNVGDGDTLVNGANISVAALQHGDTITLGDRSLRWEYTNPTMKRQKQIQPALVSGGGGGGGRVRRGGRRGSAGAGVGGAGAGDRAVQLAIEMSHRASMPASTGGKQVAVVQPQRRDNNGQMDKNLQQAQAQSSKRPRASNVEISKTDVDKSKRKSSTKVSPKNVTLQGTTKATLWIESRKSSPRKGTKQSPARAFSASRATSTGSAGRSHLSRNKSTPLRMAVLRKAQSAQKFRVMKIEEPINIDQTKQAAIMLMTGHTPKSKLVASKVKTPSYIVKKTNPVQKTPRGRPSLTTTTRTRRSKENVTPIAPTPRRPITYTLPTDTRNNKRTNQTRSTTSLEISDTDTENVTARDSNTSRRSAQRSPRKSPLNPNPKKSALKDPKKFSRKTESIKFDLSNLANNSQESTEVVTVEDTTVHSAESDDTMSDEVTLRYSDSSTSPSPRRPIHSRSSRILEKSTGLPMSLSPRHTVNLESTHTRKSSRGSLIVQKALETSGNDSTLRGSTDSTNQNGSVASAFKTHTLSPRSNPKMESYSIVDLVTMDSNESRSASVYSSAASDTNASFGTPQNTTGRITRSTIDPTLLGSSTPYHAKTGSISNHSQNTRPSRSHSNLELSKQSSQTVTDLMSTRRSKSLSTPENTQKHISVNSTRISRQSRSRSRLNDSDLMLIDGNESDASPKSSKRISRTSKSIQYDSTGHRDTFDYTNVSDGSLPHRGITTPEHKHSREDVGTPILRIQSLLDSSQNLKRGRPSKRKTIGVITDTGKGRANFRSKSMNMSARKTKLNLTKDFTGSDNNDEGAPQSGDEEVVTPKSAVKLVPEAVKNKHSTAKKPQSKRSVIDSLNQSDIVKQLFNSPVKRKLSQSMIEFSKKQLFEDDDDVTRAKKPTRNTIALIAVTPDDSILNRTEVITPELFVSPISTPKHSPNMTGIRRLFSKITPENDLRDVRGVKALLRTPRPRRSVKNDLTNVSGVKLVFARSPKNRLSDVRVKNVFASSPKNDLRRVTAVKTLFRPQKKSKESRNDLSDVRGVRELFRTRNSPTDDLRNVSGVKRALQNNSPRNDLTDVRGVRSMFKGQKQIPECDVSGLEELFNVSNGVSDNPFDRLIGKPQIKSVYSKTFSSRSAEKQKNRTPRSLHSSIDVNTNNVEEWLESELQKRTNRDSSANNSLKRELRKIATNTISGTTPIRGCRVRDTTIVKCLEAEERRSSAAPHAYSAHRLPIKKRSLVNSSAENSTLDKYRLPIKKRRVMHSTPLKNNLTATTLELSRVSPIPIHVQIALHTVQLHDQHDTSSRTKIQLNEVSGEQMKHKANIKRVDTPKLEVKLSPRKTRAKIKVTKSSPASRATRNKRTNKSDHLDGTKNRRPSMVISKKSPVLIPKAASEKSNSSVKNNSVNINEYKNASPKRITRKQKRAEVENLKPTPKKNIRARILKASVIVTKPSPVLKPRGASKVTVKESDELKNSAKLQESNIKAIRTRKAVIQNTQSPKESLVSGRRARAAAENKTKSKGGRTTVQMHNTEDMEQKPAGKRSRRTVAQSVILEDKEKSLNEVKPVKTRSRNKSPAAPASESKKKVEAKPARTRGRNRTTEPQDEKILNKKPAGERVKTSQEENIQSTSTRQSRRTKISNVSANEAKGRKRKTIADDADLVETTRGRRKIIKITETETPMGKQKRLTVKKSKVEISRNKQEDSESVNKTTITKTRTIRSRKVVEQVTAAENPLQKPTKGKKMAIVMENEPETKQTRKTTLEKSSVKESAIKKVAAKRGRVDNSVVASPVRGTRRTARTTKRNDNDQPEVTKTTGRARRR